MQRDLTITKLLDLEQERQRAQHIFIASENFASEHVQYFAGSEFTNKYAEGYPGKRYYNGCEYYDRLEDHAIDLVKKLYGCKFANVQPHSGANANLAIFKAFLKPGDRILGMDLSAGGHLSHGSKANLSGKWFDSHFYSVDHNGLLDYSEIEQKARELQPKLIIAGASAYPRQIDFRKFKEIAEQIGAYLLVDMAHYSGLIAGGVYESPIPYADFVTSTTHKTLRGARGGMILWNNDQYTKKINSAVFPGTQGGPLMNQVAAKAQAFSEALDPGFRQYTQTVVEMAQLMASEFRRRGVEVITEGTDSHIVLIKTGLKTGREVADNLEETNGIIVNKNSIPNDPMGVWETSGIRLGTSAMVTRRGFDPEYFTRIASLIINEIQDLDNEQNR
jgi:glycine hydroxymethyltransferase